MTVAASMKREVRAGERYAVNIDGTLRDPDWHPFDVTVADLSREGFRIPAVVALPAGSAICIGLPGLGPRAAMVVRATNTDYGCRFDDALAPDELAATIAAIPTASVAVWRFPVRSGSGAGAAADPNGSTSRSGRYPGAIRIALVLGISALCWAAIVGGRMLLG